MNAYDWSVVDDEPWPLYPEPAPRRIPWVLLALAVVALIAWRKSR